ncbi:MAG: hypothetical protein KC420_16785, partial [Myxococcales bacterium]|nr:hypothetical protein [Myxococcales bacterium]
FTARYTVTGPRGHTVAEGDATIGALGTFSVDVAIPEGADLGDHQVNLSVSGGWFGSARDFYHSFAVESYRAPEFEVAVERLEASPLVFGDLLKAEIQGRYLHGAPLVGGEVRYTMRRQESGYTPPGPENEGFSFGQRWTSPWGWRGWEIGPGSGGGILVAEGEGALDARGVFAVEHAVKAVEQDLHAPKGTTPAKGDAPEAATYTLEASVTDQNRQAIAGRSSFVVHPALRYVGVRADRNVYRAGERARLEAVVVDLDGKRIADAPVTIELVREETKRRAIEREGRWVYEYSTEEIAAGGCSPVSAAAPVGCELDLSKPGTYRARASVRDDAGRQAQSARTFYVYGEDATVWEQDERRVDLVPDRRRYEPGETATLLVRAPFDRAHGMVVIERDGIAETRPITVEGGSATIEVKIGATMIPNLHVGVVLDRGRVEVPGAPPEQDLGRPAQAFGTIELEVSPESKRVVVELDPDRTELAPKETLRLRLKTRTSGGEALPAALAVMVVDEGVLSLIGYQTPDPLAFFHRKRSPGARVFDLRSYLLRRQDVEPPQGNEQSENQKAPEEPMAEAEYAPPPAPGASAADRAEGGAKFAEEKASPAKPKPVLSRAANKDATTALALGGEAGAASEVSLRTLFATTAYFNPEVRTDERGEAT